MGADFIARQRLTPIGWVPDFYGEWLEPPCADQLMRKVRFSRPQQFQQEPDFMRFRKIDLVSCEKRFQIFL